MIINYKGITIEYNNKDEPIFNTKDILNMVQNFDKNMYYHSPGIIYMSLHNKLTVKEVYLICKLCDNSFDDLVMKTSPLNIKYYLQPEDLGMIIDGIGINKDVFKFIMDIVYEAEKADEENSIRRFAFEGEYKHSLLSLRDVINLVSTQYKVSLINRTPSYRYISRDYEIKVTYKHNSEHIYIEGGYLINEINTLTRLKKKYTNFEYYVLHDRYIIFHKYYRYPNVYNISNILFNYDTAIITVNCNYD